MATRPTLPGFLYALALSVLCGCAAPPPPDGDLVLIRHGKRNPEALLNYFLGSYSGSTGEDGLGSGILVRDGRKFYVDVARLRSLDAGAAAAWRWEGVVPWDSLALFVEETYYTARGAPPHLDSLRAPSEDRLVLEVDGVMTTARRTIYVPRRAVAAAVGRFADAGALLYPVGTLIVANHMLDDTSQAVLETTVMRKRADRDWDFFVYDALGRIAPATTTEPKPLRVPTQCTGCHLGTRLFEPEKSFPGAAPAGPTGPRKIHVDASLRDAEVVSRFSEHARRSDSVLGLYATIYATKLKVVRATGQSTASDDSLLTRLGL